MALVNSYLDITEYAARSVLPAHVVNGDFIDPSGTWDGPHAALRTSWQTFIASQLTIESSKINARLRKRYNVPYSAAPYPEMVLGWLVALVDPKVARKRGIDPSDDQIQSLDAAAEAALEEMKEAANSEDGLFELPLLETTGVSGVTKGGPLAYSEQSPYAWRDVQRELLNGGSR